MHTSHSRSRAPRGRSSRGTSSGGRSQSHSRSGGHSSSRSSSRSPSRSSGGFNRRSYSSSGASSSGRRSGGGGRPRGGGGRPHGGGGGRGRGRVQPTFDVSQFINRNPVTQQEPETFVPKNNFADFNLDAELQRAVTASGLNTPSPIQDEIIPHILNGRDVIGLANTGTGKTAAFLIPLIQKAIHQYARETLILAPTRELAIQIEQEFKRIGRFSRLASTVCVGGVNITPQLRSLKRKNHFIIGTPGRVLDLIERKSIRPERMGTVVLDEADRMLDMGFINDMRSIMEMMPANRETLLFSATMSPSIEGIVHEFLDDPVKVSVKKTDSVANIEQDVVHYGSRDKVEVLAELLKQPEFSKVIVFGQMKHSVEKLSKSLNTKGIKTDSIHGNKSHNQRQRALEQFKAGRVVALIATDVAARGIHVDQVSHVINFDLPATYEDYIHRIGRTGRGIHRGKALTFVP